MQNNMKKYNVQNGQTYNGAELLNEIQDNVEDVFNGNESMGDIVVNTIRSKNIFNKYDVVNGYLDGAGNVVLNYDWNVSNFIDISGFDYITTSGSTHIGGGHCFYDSNFVHISAGLNFNHNATKEVPENAKYVRFTVHNNDLNTFQAEKGTQATLYSQNIAFENINTSLTWKGVASGDLNNLVEQGIYIVASPYVENAPAPDNTFGVLIVLGGPINDKKNAGVFYVGQLILNNYSALYYRNRITEDSNWSNWKTVYFQ